jgi:hypothetical protein
MTTAPLKEHLEICFLKILKKSKKKKKECPEFFHNKICYKAL